jgi:hypothetical protein
MDDDEALAGGRESRRRCAFCDQRGDTIVCDGDRCIRHPDGQLRPSEWWVLGPVMCLGFTLIAFNIAHNHNPNLRNDVFAAAALAMIICAVMLLGLGRKLFRRRNQR